MRRIVSSLLILTVNCLFLNFQSVDARRVIRAAPNEPTTGNYVIRLKQSITHDQFTDIEGEIIKKAKHTPSGEIDSDLIKVVTIKIDDESKLEEMKHLKGVEYLEEETYAHGTAIPYSIDQIDQKCSQSLDDSYQPIGDGEGVDIYILDSGIHYTHEQFEDRAKYSGKDPIDEVEDANQKGLDCNGHGTHCASLAAGKTTGTARKANLYSVRVLSCNNYGPWSAIINGLNHVVDRASITKRPTIISMSLGGGYFKTVDDLVTDIAKNKGIPIIVAAGNDRSDACNNSPASNSRAITVGASRADRKMYYYSNGGTCVDIIAPGQNVLGADRECDTCSKYLTGTSMATPLVAGVAAIHLQRTPKMTPADLKKKLANDACVNTLDFKDLKTSLQSITPNKLLNIIGNCGGEFFVDSSDSKEVVSPGYPQNYPNGVECVYKLTTDRGSVIRLTMNELATYNSSDYLQVIDGYHVDTIFLLASLDTSMPAKKVYLSTVNALTLRFTANTKNGGKGFRATFDSAEPDVPVTPPTVTSTVTSVSTTTETKVSTASLTITTSRTVFVTSLSVVTQTALITTTASETETVFKTSTETVIVPSTVEVTSTSYETETETETVLQTATETVIAPNASTVTTTSTVTAEPTIPTPINILPSGTPTNDMCCQVLNNVDFLSYALLQGMNSVMERGIDYISKLVDKNSSFTVEDIIKPNKSDVIEMDITSGTDPAHPADSCANVTGDKSGEYWIRMDDGSVHKVFCELEKEKVKGMTRIVNINMTLPNATCPDGFGMIEVQGKKLCGRGTSERGCTSAFFNTSGMSYTKVCGKVKGYQFSSPNAFYWFTRTLAPTVNDLYVDGVVLTYNSTDNVRSHIWTLAAAIDEIKRDQALAFACPCTQRNETYTHKLPKFMGDDYYCDTGSRQKYVYKTYYLDDPLWDGKGCGPESSCCEKAGVFCKEIGEPTKSPIEVRLCGNEPRSNEDTPLEEIELYIQ